MSEAYVPGAEAGEMSHGNLTNQTNTFGFYPLGKDKLKEIFR